MSLGDIFLAGVLLGLILLAGRVLRDAVPPLRWALLPASVVAGLLGLAVGPEVAGRWAGVDLLPEGVHGVWREAPGLLITVVFATLFLGKEIPGPRRIWEMAAPQATFGQTVAWGQYVIGLTLAILVLTPVFGIHPAVGALIEIGFEGGHGTAAGLGATFDELGFEEGRDLALGMATIGVVLAVVLGSVLIKIERRHSWRDGEDFTRKRTMPEGDEADDRPGILECSEERAILEPLTLQLGLIGLAIALGWLLQQGLIRLEAATWGGPDGVEVLRHVPLFPLAMIGGVALQVAIDRLGLGRYVSPRLMGRIGATALDLTIAAAVATLSLQILAANWEVLAILATAGAVWNVAAFWLLAPRIIHRAPFERGIGDFGQSMGMTVTGLLLMRMADPENRTRAIESFGYKQLLFEPFVGGGVVTAMSVPLIFAFGPVTMLAVSSAIFAAWLVFAWALFMRHAPGGR